MAEETNNQKVCVSCGTSDKTSKITDKLKFKNKSGGTIYIHYKTGDQKGTLCRGCWKKNLKQFHDKIELSSKE